jgi:hypothetical protein
MTSIPRECGADISPSEKCAEIATVKPIRRVFQKRESNSGQVEHVLTETHYNIDCPKCGSRTLIERHAVE